MTTFCRLLFVLLYALWQGGFLFYTAAVVPIGTEVLGSTTEQGFITRLVTVRINQCGAAALAVWLPIIIRETARRRWWRRGMLLVWGVLAAIQAALFALHPHLDSLLDLSRHAVTEPERFYALHRIYLWTISVQWGFAVVLLGMMICVWSRPQLPRSGAAV